MTPNSTKLSRAETFRTRLGTAMALRNATQSSLARETGVDRSTLSQLLKNTGARLPNAQLIADCAGALGVSTDWLLGLSDLPEQASDLVASAITMTDAPRAFVDEQIFGWHQEAAGYKIRHVPASLPDMLKTNAVLRWEYAPSLGRTIEQAIGASADRLAWMRRARSDYEIAFPLSELSSFANATGYYHGIDKQVRLDQLQHLLELHEQLYPTLRLHLFDKRALYSAPVTVFGPLLAALYLGQHYLVFRDTDRVQAIIRHFDTLVRGASIPSRQLPDHVHNLMKTIT